MYDAVQRLSRWFEKDARDLPWRRTRDPYAIWISEVMLQQTQVATVIPYYHRFLEKFPSVEALAEAREDDVLRQWSGLGYYSRAKNLRRAAQYLRDHHNGNFPRDREAILTVPGVGPYTAGAVLSIAFDQAEPLVDGNVQRVFARYFGLADPIESAVAKSFFWERAAEWVKAATSPRVLNQALMELGATICTKANPKCGACPLQETCVANARGLQSELPVRKPRREAIEIWWLAAVLECQGRVLLQQNAPRTWWAGLWDFPHLEVKNARALEQEAARFAENFPSLRRREILPVQKHTVTHHRLRVVPVVYHLTKREAVDGEEKTSWQTPEKALACALSSLARKVLTAYLEGPPTLVLQ